MITPTVPSILTNYSDEELLAYARHLGLDTLGSVSRALMDRLEARIRDLDHIGVTMGHRECDVCGAKWP